MKILDFSEELKPLTAEEIYQVFTNTLQLCSGFGIIFLQCSPAETNRLIPRVRRELPGKNIEVLDLVEPIDNLYRLVEGRADRTSLNILFIRGLEKSLESDIKPGYKGLGDYYNLNTVPPILSHLNQQRENFRDHFGNICFVFVLRRFAIRYFVRRAPDFYDWNSGVFEIPDLPSQGTIVFPELINKSVNNVDAAQAMLTQGNLLFFAGRYEEAITFYDQTVEIKSDKYEAWNNRGNSLNELGRYEEAIISYDRAVEIKPDFHEAWSNRGVSLSNLGRYEEAIASYDRAVEIKPDNHIVWNNRGNSLSNLGRDEESTASFDRAVEIKPDFHEAWYSRGIPLFNLGRYEEAITSYDRAVEIKPDFHEAWSNRGVSLFNLGRYEEAIASYGRAVEIKPDFHEAWQNKGWSYFNQGKYPESISCYEHAIAIKPDKYDSWHNKGLVQFLTSDYAAALASWRQAFGYIRDPAVPRYYEDISGLIQEFIEELIPRFTQPPIQQTLLIPLLAIYQEADVITELGAALVNTLNLIVAPAISDHTAAQWLTLWQTSSLGHQPAMELPLRLMATAIEYKKDPSKRQRLWLNLPSEERPILDKALKLLD
jgi:tetratricopeptide (TPR) repeat protein